MRRRTSSMRRRTFLAAVGASIGLAGCTSRGSTPESNPGTDTGTPEGTDTATPAGADPAAMQPSDGFTLGETTGDVNPHGLTVRNDGEDSRTIDLTISDADTGETLLDRTYSLGSGERIEGELRGPAAYDVGVEVTAAGTEHVTTVDHFDTCNEYGTTVTIAADGTMESQLITTLVACDPGSTPPST